MGYVRITQYIPGYPRTSRDISGGQDSRWNLNAMQAKYMAMDAGNTFYRALAAKMVAEMSDVYKLDCHKSTGF
jgi:hypothetical protein